MSSDDDLDGFMHEVDLDDLFARGRGDTGSRRAEARATELIDAFRSTSQDNQRTIRERVRTEGSHRVVEIVAEVTGRRLSN